MKILRRLLLSIVIVSFSTSGPRAAVAAEPPGDVSFGVLVMAHGGSPEWNQQVLAAVAPLRDRHPVEVAFGMADACSMRDAVRQLESGGAQRIAVVRLFVSGESWYERTEQILGLREGAPPAPAPGTPADECSAEHASHAQHRMAFFRIESAAIFEVSREGLLEADETGKILVERVKSLSREPSAEDVLVLAHGPADDAENQRWLDHLATRVAGVRALGFREVRVETLREDWPEKRVEAEARIRSYVQRGSREGRRVIVLPFRLSGFGPYAKVLDGLDYAADQQGLLPHELVTGWVERQVDELSARLAAGDRREGGAAAANR